MSQKITPPKMILSILDDDKIDEDVKEQIEKDKYQLEKMTRCQELLMKLLDDEYFNIKGDSGKDSYHYALELKEKDKEELYFTLAKNLECWWT